jgi:membrane protein YdbS with pleckstrin-like domain
MRDPYDLRRRRGMGMWRRLQMYAIGIVLLLIVGALLGHWLLGLVLGWVFSFKFIAFAVVALIVLLVIMRANMSRRSNRRW